MNSVHPRWERTVESADFFRDEDRLVVIFYGLAAASAALLVLLAAGLWQVCRAAAAPPTLIGVASGWIFTGPAQGLGSLRDSDLDPQFADTVQVLFGRTDRGVPPAIRDFCAPEVVAAVDRAYGDASSRYPAGFVQTLTLLEAKPVSARPGLRVVDYRGLLASRSAAAAQMSPIFLECTFAVFRATPLNASGWRLVHIDTLARDDFYRDERQKSEREALGLAVPADARASHSP